MLCVTATRLFCRILRFIFVHPTVYDLINIRFQRILHILQPQQLSLEDGPLGPSFPGWDEVSHRRSEQNKPQIVIHPGFTMTLSLTGNV